MTALPWLSACLAVANLATLAVTWRQYLRVRALRRNTNALLNALITREVDAAIRRFDTGQ